MPSGFFSQEGTGGNPAREMHSTATSQSYAQAFQFPLYCPFLLSLLSQLGILTASPSIHLSFLISPCFSVSSPSFTFPLAYSPQSFIPSLSLQTPSFHSFHFAIKPLLWYISCLCSWQALQEKTTGSSETLLPWKVTADLWAVRFWPRGGHTTEFGSTWSGVYADSASAEKTGCGLFGTKLDGWGKHYFIKHQLFGSCGSGAFDPVVGTLK